MDEEPRDFFTHTQLLKEALIRVPAVSAIGYELRARGLEVDRLPLTVEEAVETYQKFIH